MEKSRQRNPHPKIIDRPELKSPIRHILEGSITLALWAVWLYWVLPLITLILWLLGIKMFYMQIFSEDIFMALIRILKNGGAAILIILTLKLIWIYYNYHIIFKRKGYRRKEFQAHPDKAASKFFEVDEELLEEVKSHKRIEVTLDGKQVTIKPPSSRNS